MTGSLADDADLRFLEHGGRLDAARAAFPGAPEPWLDLSTGISPWPYPVPELPAESWQRLPDVSALESLLEIAKKCYRGPPMAHVIALPGADAGLNVLPWLFRTPMRVAVLSPTYGPHAQAWSAAGHSVSEVGSLEEIGRAAIVVAVNPNNPDGRVLSHADLAGATERVRRRDGLLVIDEAFADADPTRSILPVAARLDHTVVLRSLGKFYGAAGARLGFAITSHPVAERLSAALGSWPVSAAAIAYGHAALTNEVWASGQRKRLSEASASLDGILREAGLKVLGGTALFRLASPALPRSLFHALAQNGILVRPFKDLAALRFGLPGDSAGVERLREVLMRCAGPGL
jgi:cobalamin biosynthetic protein CobC